MLFLLNKLHPRSLDEIRLLGGDEDKAVLLVSDAVYHATPAMIAGLKAAGVDEIYVSEEAVRTRAVTADDSAELVDYDRMADLIMGEHDKVVTI
jgi:tRNA 2-thiouridine synthesizing protein B